MSSYNHSSFSSVISQSRPDAGTRYRLLDSDNRFFPPLNQPAHYALHRVDQPSAPAGVYKIRFEQEDGTVVPPEDGKYPEIVLGLNQAPLALPDDIETHKERLWQKREKKGLKNQRDTMLNDTLGQFLGMLVESQRQSTEMIKTFSQGQKELLDQQNAMLRAQRDMTPTPQNDWSGALKEFIGAGKDVMMAAMMANGVEKKPTGESSIIRALLKAKEELGKAALQDPGAPNTPALAEKSTTAAADESGRPEPPKSEPPKAQTPIPETPSRPEPPSPELKEGQKSARVNASTEPAARTRDVDASQAQEHQETEAEAVGIPWTLVMREVKRRILMAGGDMMGWVLTSPENFLEWWHYVAAACPPSRLALAELGVAS